MKILDIIVEATPVIPTLNYADIEKVALAWTRASPENAAKAEKAAQLALSKYNADFISIFKQAALIAKITQLNVNLYALEQMAKEPLENFQTLNPAFASFTIEQKASYIKGMRDQIYGVFSVQILLPALTAWLAKGGLTEALLKTLGKVGVGIFGSKISGLIKIVAVVGMEGFLLWLNTDGGRTWLANSIFMPMIMSIGAGVTWGWDKIWPTIQDITGIPIDKINPNTQKDVEIARAATDIPGFGKQMSQQEWDKRSNALAQPRANSLPGMY
jgi:hypothetical protein